jgi:hypothetical protein
MVTTHTLRGPFKSAALFMGIGILFTAGDASAHCYPELGPLIYKMCMSTHTNDGSPTSSSSVVADIENRNAQAQRNLEQGFNALRQIIQNRQAERAASVSDRLDKRLPPEDVGSGLSPNAYPAVSDSYRCNELRSTYHSGNPGPAAECMTDNDWTSTYTSGSYVGQARYSEPEPVIDGSNIPSIIDFSGKSALDPFGNGSEQLIQRSFDDSEIKSALKSPGSPDPNLDPFNRASHRNR